MRRPALAAIVTVLALSTALASCSDDDSDSAEVEPPAAAAPDSHEISQAFAASSGDVTGHDAPEALTTDAPPRLVARSARLEAEGTLGDFGCSTDASHAPGADTVVDCALPHSSETYAVLEMDATWPEDFDAYAEGTQTGTLWRAWAGRACDALQQQANGSGALATALGLDDAAVYPAGFTLNGFATSLRPDWEAGDRRTSCVAFTIEGHEAAGNWTPLMMSADRPDPLSNCKAYVDGEYAVVPCSEQHWREEAFFVNAAAVLDQAFIDSVDPAAVTDEQWATLDEVCARGEEAVVGAERDDLMLFSDVVVGYWGDFPGWYPINCGIVPEDGSQDMVGSAIGVGDGDLELVPTAVPAS